MDFTLYSTSMTALGIRPGAFSVATAKFYCLSLSQNYKTCIARSLGCLYTVATDSHDADIAGR
jgi:hypothetical protein